MSAVLYGKDPAWKVDGYRRDRNGAVTLEVIKPWAALLVPDGDRLTLPDMPTPPSIPGFTVATGSWKKTRDGGMAVSFQYEGIEPGMTGSGPEGEMGVRWSGNGNLYQRYIKTHPEWAKLRDQFEWDDNRREFPDTLTDPISTVGFYGGAFNTSEKLNPMRGVTGYDDYSCILTKSYLSATLPAGIFLRQNTIVKKPWAALPNLADRDWKYGAPDWSPHGNIFRIAEHLELSGEGGWIVPLYKKG